MWWLLGGGGIKGLNGNGKIQQRLNQKLKIKNNNDKIIQKEKLFKKDRFQLINLFCLTHTIFLALFYEWILFQKLGAFT